MAIVSPARLDELEDVIGSVIEPAATRVDETGNFPRPAITSLGEAGFLGLVSEPDLGGGGEGIASAAIVVERIARSCASTAMVLCMHYVATALLEHVGKPREVREEIARGRHLTTLAFSESGSRSHFWAPLSSATEAGDDVILNAHKSWVTSAGEADSYVWSSTPLESPGASTLWLVPAGAEGLKVAGPFNGLGMRGNASTPITAVDVKVPRKAMIGGDGGGFDLMMGVVLPWFQILNAASAVGTMEAAVVKTARHAGGVRIEHLAQSLAGFPTVRAYVARMRISTDSIRALLLDCVNAVESDRDDKVLRVLEIKAAAGEAATQVTDLAMRVCGGAAFRKEVGVERHFRDARAASVMAPTTDVLYDFIGKAACGLPLFE
jgi:alkylation response protein AidB-like acyl-CoA dehydrogenase